MEDIKSRLEEITFIDNELQLYEYESFFHWISHQTILAVDTETSGFDPHTCKLLTLQIGNYNRQFVIDLTKVSIDLFKKELESKILIMHNAKFDLKFLYKHRIYPTNVIDTMLNEVILYTGNNNVSKGLGKLAKMYLDIDLDKGVRDRITEDTIYDEEVIVYSADDVKYLHKIYEMQLAKLKSKDLLTTAKVEYEYVKVLAYTEFHGMSIDAEAWKKISADSKMKLVEITNQLNQYILMHNIKPFIKHVRTLFDDYQEITINWNSSQQVIKLLNEVGVDVDTVDKKKLATIDHPIVKQLLERSYWAKRASTYGYDFLKYINQSTGRIHTDYWQILKTGRISSKNPNLQNIPATEEIRKCFSVEPGRALIVGDYSAQESRILAEYANESSMLEFYLSGKGDIHSFVAQKLYPDVLGELSYNEIKDQYGDLRKKAKGANFALAYGGNGATIANNLSVTKEVGDEVEAAYFKAFPDVRAYFDKIKSESIAQGYIDVDRVLKRKVYHDDIAIIQRGARGYINDKQVARRHFIAKGEYERRAMNYPIQSSAAGMVKLASIAIFDQIIKEGKLGKVFLSAYVHDEIHLEVPSKDAEKWKDIMKQCMEDAAKLYCPRIGVEVNPDIADYWIKD